MWIFVFILAFVGLLFGGFPGAIIGAVAGFLLKQRITHNLFKAHITPEQQTEAQSAFFRATFMVMGLIAKADGRINELEIQQATRLMDNMQLSPNQRRQAIEFFNQGKSGAHDLQSIIIPFKNSVTAISLIHVFLEIQLQAAHADGSVSSPEKAILNEICRLLNISHFTLEMLNRRVQAQRAFYQHRSGYGYQRQQKNHSNIHSFHSTQALKEAYQALDIDPSSTNQDVKRAYRKLMSEHHPDKLVSKGLPKEMMDVAKKKTQEIQSAYDLIQKHRKRNN